MIRMRPNTTVLQPFIRQGRSVFEKLLTDWILQLARVEDEV